MMLEIIGTIFGITCVILAARENIFTWYTGIISVIAFGILFWQKDLYMGALLQFFYIIISIMGIINWKRIDVVRINYMNSKKYTIIMGSTFVLFMIIGASLATYFDNPDLILDSAITSLSIVATFMLINKTIDNWIVWFQVDVIAIVLYVHLDLYLVAFTYFIYLIISLIGFRSWQKKYQLEYDEI